MECLFDFKNGITSNKFPFSDKKGGKNENLFNTPRQLKLSHVKHFRSITSAFILKDRDRISRLESILRDQQIKWVTIIHTLTLLSSQQTWFTILVDFTDKIKLPSNNQNRTLCLRRNVPFTAPSCYYAGTSPLNCITVKRHTMSHNPPVTTSGKPKQVHNLTNARKILRKLGTFKFDKID